MTSLPDNTVDVIAPLPTTMAHYNDTLLEVLRAAGAAPTLVPSTSFERPASGLLTKAAVASAALTQRLRGGDNFTIVTWPALGLADPLTWLRHRQRVLLLVHDPVPLRRQHGMGRVARGGGAWAARQRVHVAVHSAAAADVLTELRWPTPIRLPHPLAVPAEVPQVQRRSVVVFGQWKPTRSLDPLRSLGEAPSLSYDKVLAGRGWPDVPGWRRDDRFLTEVEVDRLLQGAAVVVIPYQRYFQSGVAVRALEQLAPVVAGRHPQLEELYGSDWPGFITGAGDWPAAVQRVQAVDPELLRRRRADYWARCVREWRDALVSLSVIAGVRP